MIAKVKLCNSPGKLINYILSDKKGPDKMKERAQIIDTNYCHGTSKGEIRSQFQVLLSNCKLKNPAMHIMLSMAPGEVLKEHQKSELIYAACEKMGMADYPYIAVEHLDTSNHSHFHIAVGRKSPITGKTLSDSNSFQKMMVVCREAEKAFGLKEVANPRDQKTARFDRRKAKMRNDILTAINKSTSLSQFVLEMLKSGYKVEKQRGIAFTDDKGMRAKGSDPQIGFPLGKLFQIFEQKGIQREAYKGIDDIFLVNDEKYQPSNLVKDPSFILLDLLNGAVPAGGSLIPSFKRPSDDEDIEEWKRKKRRKGFKR